MSILTRREILREMDNGRIIGRRDLVSPNSMYVTVGPEAWVVGADDDDLPSLVWNPYAPDQSQRYTKIDPVGIDGLYKHKTGRAFFEKDLDGLRASLPEGTQFLPLITGRFYLLTSCDPVGTILANEEDRDDDYDIVQELRTTSTFARMGGTVSLCSGYANAGFNDRWVMGTRLETPFVRSQFPEEALLAEGVLFPLALDTVIGQIVFHKVARVNRPGKPPVVTRSQQGGYLPGPLKHRPKPLCQYGKC